MLKFLFLLTIFTSSFYQLPLYCAEVKTREQKNVESDPTHLTKEFEGAEMVCLAAGSAVLAPLALVAKATEYSHSPEAGELMMAYMQYIGAPFLWAISGCATYVEYAKLLMLHRHYGKELQSFYTKAPKGATYHLAITMDNGIESKFVSFENKDVLALMNEAKQVVATWSEQHQTPNKKIELLISPHLVTARGRTVTLATQEIIWNPQVGIDQKLRRIFLLTGTRTYAQEIRNTSLYAAAATAFFYAPILVYLNYLKG